MWYFYPYINLCMISFTILCQKWAKWWAIRDFILYAMIFLQNNPKQNKKLSHAEISSLTEAHLQSLEFHLSIDSSASHHCYKLNWKEGLSKISEFWAQGSNGYQWNPFRLSKFCYLEAQKRTFEYFCYVFCIPLKTP